MVFRRRHVVITDNRGDMDNTSISTEELREMLNEYSPEQQMEENAKAISEGAKALADATASMNECLAVMPLVIEQLNSATTLKISNDEIMSIINIGHDVGKEIAAAFKQNVDSTICKAKKEVKRVSIPAPDAYCLLITLIFLSIFVGVIVINNLISWHNNDIDTATFGIGMIMLLSIMATLLVSHKGWI